MGVASHVTNNKLVIMKNKSLRVVDFKFRTVHAKDKLPTKTDQPPTLRLFGEKIKSD